MSSPPQPEPLQRALTQPQKRNPGVSTGMIPEDEDEKEEVMILTRQQNNERFLKKTRTKQSQVAKLTEQLEDLKWQLFYGNSEKDKEVKLMRQALLLKEQELEELRTIQLSALSHPLPNFSSSFSFSSSSSSSASSIDTCSNPPSQAEISRLYGAIVQALQHQGLIMRHLAAASTSSSPDLPHPAVSERLDLIERDVNAKISAALGDHLSTSASTLLSPSSSSNDDNLFALHQKLDLLLARQEAEVLRKQQKRLQKERDQQLRSDGWAVGETSPSLSVRLLVISIGAVACGLFYLFSPPTQGKPSAS